MRIKRLGLVAAIVASFGFSCHNEPEYQQQGMSNPPGGSGAAPAPATAPSTPATAAPATTSAAAKADSTKGAAKKKP